MTIIRIVSVLHAFLLCDSLADAAYFFIERQDGPGVPSHAQFISGYGMRLLDCTASCTTSLNCHFVVQNRSGCFQYSLNTVTYSLPITSSNLTSGDSHLLWKASGCVNNGDFTSLMNSYIYEGIENRPNSQTLLDVGDDLLCYKKCQTTYGSSCNFFSYSEFNRSCEISAADFYNGWTLISWSPAARSCYKSQPEKWKMVYRRPKLTKTGYAQEVTGPWLDEEYFTRVELPAVESATPTGFDWTVLKSPLVYYWDYLGITQVKVSMYKDGQELQYVNFGGLNSTTSSWLQHSNILSSSWSDLDSSQAYTEFNWTALGISGRAVYFAKTHDGCPGDIIWVSLIQDQLQNVCPWEVTAADKIPRLLFSNSATAAPIHDLVEADYVVFYIKFP